MTYGTKILIQILMFCRVGESSSQDIDTSDLLHERAKEYKRIKRGGLKREGGQGEGRRRGQFI